MRARVPRWILRCYHHGGGCGEAEAGKTMATYAIGDIQGCFGTFRRLLDRIAFDPAKDRLLLVGDLVNRGPQSAEVLRWAMRNERAVRTVLGNHDLHLIGRALGVSS